MLRSLQTVQLGCLTEHLLNLRPLTPLLSQQHYVANSLLPDWCYVVHRPANIANSASVPGSNRHAQSITSLAAISRTQSMAPFSCLSIQHTLSTLSTAVLGAGSCSTLRHSSAHQASHLRNFQCQRHLSAGGASKVIEQQQEEEKKEQENLKAHQTQFDRSLGARKAKNAEHQSVIAHMSDVRTPRSLLNKSTKQTWEVVEFHPDQTIIETTKTPEQLNLQPRDISIFATNKLGVQAQRATITPRNNAVLFRTEIAKAIIYKDKAVLFHSRRLSFLAESIVTEVSHSLRASTGELQRLLPIQRALTEMQHDVKEAREAIAEVADNNAILAAVCLTEGATALDWSTNSHKPLHMQTSHMRIAAALLESYERQVQSVEGALKEMVENMDSTRDVWAMQLDTIRNRIIRVELLVAVASFSLMVSTVPASFFGMNLTSGLEDAPNTFWPVVTTSISFSALTFALVYAYWRWWPNRRHRRRVKDMAAIRDLLVHHMDDLDEIMDKLHVRTDVTKKEFQRLVIEAVDDITVDEADLLYRVFDTNRDGFVEMTELVKAGDKLAIVTDSDHHHDWDHHYNNRYD